MLRLPLLFSAVFVISLFMGVLSPFSRGFLFLMMPVSVQSYSVFMLALGPVLSPKQLRVSEVLLNWCGRETNISLITQMCCVLCVPPVCSVSERMGTDPFTEGLG